MVAWIESLVGTEYASAVMWTAAALVLLIVLLIVVRILRGVSSGTFVMGGRNRKTRLAVMDATAVDANRRLVLVRRDDVEHLILIGGPTDVVVEQNIRLLASNRTARAAEADLVVPTAVEPAHPQPAVHAETLQPVIKPEPAPRATIEPVAHPRETIVQPPAPAPQPVPQTPRPQPMPERVPQAEAQRPVPAPQPERQQPPAPRPAPAPYVPPAEVSETQRPPFEYYSVQRAGQPAPPQTQPQPQQQRPAPAMETARFPTPRAVQHPQPAPVAPPQAASFGQASPYAERRPQPPRSEPVIEVAPSGDARVQPTPAQPGWQPQRQNYQPATVVAPVVAAPVTSVAAAGAPEPDLDLALLDDIEFEEPRHAEPTVSIDDDHSPAEPRAERRDPEELALEEEMSRLLDDLSPPRR